MSYQDEFANGRRNAGSWSNQPGSDAFNKGAADAQREHERRMSQIYGAQSASTPAPSSSRLPSSFPSPWRKTPAHATDAEKVAHAGANSLGAMTNSFAGTAAVGFVVWTLVTSAHWTWASLLGGSLAAALIGVVAGALVYVVLIVLAWAARLVMMLLGLGVVLHLLGVIDLWHVFGVLWRTVGRML